MAGVPHVFGNATATLPLSQLDDNFNTQITIGTTQVGLGNTVSNLAGLANVSTSHIFLGDGYSIGVASTGTNYLVASVGALSGLILILKWNSGDGFAICVVASSGAITTIASSNALGNTNAFDTVNNIGSNGGVGIGLVVGSGQVNIQSKTSGYTGVVSIGILTVQ